jgi:hypothetical protein
MTFAWISPYNGLCSAKLIVFASLPGDNVIENSNFYKGECPGQC